MSKMSVNDFKNNLNNPARAYLWEVVFTNPIGGGDSEAMEMRCQTTEIPGRSFGEILLPFRATAGVKFAGKLVMSHSWPTVFVESTDKKVFTALHSWSEAITNAETGIGLPDVSIKANIYLRLMDVADVIYQKIKLVGCYPQKIAETPIAFDNEGAIMYNVDWSYDWWDPID